jgi:phosphoglycerate dehydrogenase-like enzyme
MDNMDSFNVVVVTPAYDKSLPYSDNENIRRITEVSPKIKVKDASAMMMAERRGDNSENENLDNMLVEADVIFGFGLMLPKDLLSRAPRLKWLQLMSAGADRLRDTDIWQSKVTITGVSGIHASPIGEFVLGFMLMFAKSMPLCFQMKQKREWQRYTPHLLRDKTVGVAGLGHIGSEVARLSKSFGMKVIATRRSVKRAGKVKNVDLLLPQAQMKEMLSKSDYVVLSVPLTPETRHIISETELGLMKPSSYIINVGRGDLIDEEALIRALDERKIAGAGLDVTAIEPLPKDSRLWDMDNVILSPHVSGGMEEYMGQATEFFCDNIHRYLEGKKLRNVIDRKKGY